MIWPCDIFWGGGIFWCCSPPGGSNWAIFITPVYSTTELVQLAANYISIDGVNIFEMEKYRLMNNKLHLKVKATEWQLFITLGKLVAEPQLIRKTIGSHAVNQSATGPETGNRRQSAIWIKSGSATTSNRRRWISRSGLYRTAVNPQNDWQPRGQSIRNRTGNRKPPPIRNLDQKRFSNHPQSAAVD